MEIPQLLVHNPRDNVGVVVVEGLKAGTDMLCVVTENDSSFRLTARSRRADRAQDRTRTISSPAIPTIKYGEDVGQDRRRRRTRVPTSTPTISRRSAGQERAKG